MHSSEMLVHIGCDAMTTMHRAPLFNSSALDLFLVGITPFWPTRLFSLQHDCSESRYFSLLYFSWLHMHLGVVFEVCSIVFTMSNMTLRICDALP